MGVISSTSEIEPEGYEAQEVPIATIKKMIKNGTWEGSIEEKYCITLRQTTTVLNTRKKLRRY